MSDILSKDELRVFVVHPFYHDKIELLEKLKTRTRELLAMYVPMHSINVHSLRHYISLIPGGELDRWTLIIEVVSDVINSMNNKNMTYSVMAAFEDYMIECAYFDEYFDQTMTERLKELSGAIISFSNRETDEVFIKPVFNPKNSPAIIIDSAILQPNMERLRQIPRCIEVDNIKHKI